MTLAAKQGAAWNISDCFIISSGTAFLKKTFFKNSIIIVGQHFSVKKFSI